MTSIDSSLSGAAKAFREVLHRQRPDLAFEVTIAKRLNRIARTREHSMAGSNQSNPVQGVVSSLPDPDDTQRAA